MPWNPLLQVAVCAALMFAVYGTPREPDRIQSAKASPGPTIADCIWAVKAGGQSLKLLPARDGRGCPDADDAMINGHFLGQTLSVESRLTRPDPIRPQPQVRWRDGKSTFQEARLHSGARVAGFE